MSVHQLTPRRNSAPRAERAVRAAACAVVRQAWELVLREEPPVAEAVRTAERFVRQEADEGELSNARAAAVTRADRSTWNWHRFLTLGGLEQVTRFSLREACRATCLESPSEALETAVEATARALAARDVYGSPVHRALSEVMRMRRSPRRVRWPRVRRTLHVDLVQAFEMQCRAHTCALSEMVERRLASGDDRTQGSRQPIVLPQSDSLILFGWGLPLVSNGGLPVKDPDGLLEKVVCHPRMDVLWRACRAEWRAWLVAVARTFAVIPQKEKTSRLPPALADFRAIVRAANARARDATPFARTVVNEGVLQERRTQVWYALDPAATRLEIGAIWCMFGALPQDAWR